MGAPTTILNTIITVKERTGKSNRSPKKVASFPFILPNISCKFSHKYYIQVYIRKHIHEKKVNPKIKHIFQYSMHLIQFCYGIWIFVYYRTMIIGSWFFLKTLALGVSMVIAHYIQQLGTNPIYKNNSHKPFLALYSDASS